MNVLFLKSKTFLAQELENALKKRPDINLLIAALPEQILSQSVNSVFDQIKHILPALVITINNAGTDLEGNLAKLIETSGSFLCNWYIDDPLYESIFYNRVIKPSKNRVDFVSEESFLPALKHKGFNAHFLPLAVDPKYFAIDENVVPVRDVAFVGNSSLQWLDSLITEDVQKELEKFAPLINSLKTKYSAAPAQANLKMYLLKNPALWQRTTNLSPEKFLFLMEWLVGYFYRRDFVIAMAQHFNGRFTCFGDVYWSTFINANQVSTDACYYSNLCSYYQSTKVNLNINRIQIKTSFTQRIFDCKASGAFVLTEKRNLNSRYFTTQGPHQEIVEFSSWPQCIELIEYYCTHEDERQHIALAGRKKVLEFHTYDNRIEEIFQQIASLSK